MNPRHWRDISEEDRAYHALMEAARGLDRIDEHTGIMPDHAWPEYNRAYYAWLELVRS
jgi:hypothetical protein